MLAARQVAALLGCSVLLGCRPAEPEPPSEVQLLTAELSSDGHTLHLEFDGPVRTAEHTAEAFRLSRIAHSDERGSTTTWYTDVSLVTCIAGRLRGLNGPCDPRAIPPTLLSLASPDTDPSATISLTLDPPASDEVLDLVCRDNGTLAAFCAGNARYTNCAEFIALHHLPGEVPTLTNAFVVDRSGEWARGLQARESWFMELVTPGVGPEESALTVTCRE